jgi:hypothetical protein
MDSYRAAFDKQDMDEEMLAHEWAARVFEPVIRAIPKALRGKLEPAEIFHQLLDHRRQLAQDSGRDIPLAEAVGSYVENVLQFRRDEATMINPPTGAFTSPIAIPGGDLAGDDDDDDSKDWRLTV